MSDDRKIVIPVVAAIDGYVLETECAIEPGVTRVQDVLVKTAILEQLSIRNRGSIGYGSYGQPKAPEDALEAGDRLEILSKLRLDPTELRRLRGLEGKKASKGRKGRRSEKATGPG